MRTKAHKLKDDLYIIELTDENIKRLFVVGNDYDLAYEIMSTLNDKKININDYIKTLDISMLYDYLSEINDDADDYLYKDNIENLLIGGDNNG